MKEPTTIQIEKKTRKKLKTLRMTKHETYDEIINRLVKNNTSNANEQKVNGGKNNAKRNSPTIST